MTKQPLFSTILDTYYRPDYLRYAVSRLRAQTHERQEIILVNNAGTPETVEALGELKASDSRIKIVEFTENQFSYDDPLMMLDTCLNAGLKAATGDFVWYQADDDFIAEDYAERMIKLFEERPECITAAGLPVCVDGSGKIVQEKRTSNFRPRFMDGKDLALAILRGDRSKFDAAGTIFTIRREALLNAGGYHRSLEVSQLYGILPFGMTGFDEKAEFYWRRHEGQLNTTLTAIGQLGIREMYSLIDEWRLEDRWRVFGAEVASEVIGRLRDSPCRAAGIWTLDNATRFRFKAAWRILSVMWANPKYWWNVLIHVKLIARRRAAEAYHAIGRKAG